MIRTSITPQQTDIQLSVPPHYVGKKLEVLLYSVEEVTEEPAAAPAPSVMAQFWGVLSDESAQDLREQAEASRNEWERTF
ncbi:MAG TPA: hypothetical protein VFO93_19740 [Hymenobacter sp.]|uniref:hypothetical protein n=1 Tax=Hymenobacter sp. TaxID=1898978 RepID=UPI002D7E2E61|nr:hypothetical protein [Hymenobacter sp.]HET9505788.1 hypothetical protein [Hymenobacter sp.]